MSYMLQILGKFIIFKDLQMIEKSLFDIFNHIKVRKNAPSLHLQVSPRTLCLGVLEAGVARVAMRSEERRVSKYFIYSLSRYN